MKQDQTQKYCPHYTFGECSTCAELRKLRVKFEALEKENTELKELLNGKLFA